MSDSSDRRPLAGIRVLDMSRVFSGPWGMQIVGDLGAKVIKLEQPRRRDGLRRLGPPLSGQRSWWPTRGVAQPTDPFQFTPCQEIL